VTWWRVHRALRGLLQFGFTSQQTALSSNFTSCIHVGRTGFCWVSCQGLLEGGLAAQRGPARAAERLCEGFEFRKDGEGLQWKGRAASIQIDVIRTTQRSTASGWSSITPSRRRRVTQLRFSTSQSWRMLLLLTLYLQLPTPLLGDAWNANWSRLRGLNPGLEAALCVQSGLWR
jgi:hypothetical protein